MSDYHKNPARSSSEIALFLSDPIEWYHRYRLGDWEPEPPTKAMELGTLIHKMIEHQGTDAMVRRIPVAVLNEQGHCKGAAWTEWKKENKADIYLKPGENDPLETIWQNLSANDWFVETIYDSDREVEHHWTDAVFGPCRCMWDLVTGGDTLVDWKSTNKRDARSFAVDAYKMNYDIRLAFYRIGFRDKYGKNPDVYIGAINTSGGCEFTPFLFPSDWLDDAEAKLYDICEQMDSFDIDKHRNKRPQLLERPKWADRE